MNTTEHIYNNLLLLLSSIFICSVFMCLIYFYYKNKNSITNIIGITIPPEILVKNNKLRGTIIDMLYKISIKYPDLSAIMIKKNNIYEPITYSTYFEKVLNFADSTNYWIGSRINCTIIGSNSTGWFYSHLGTMLNKGISTSIYPNSSSDHIEYVLQNSDSKLLIIDGESQLNKLVDINLHKIKIIVYYSPINEILINKFSIPIISMGNFMSERKQIQLSDYPTLDDDAAIIYTSGTTDHPKGAIITHTNIMASVYSIINDIQNISDQKLYVGEKFISYLPLNHILAQLMDIYIPICTMGKVFISDRDSMNKSLNDTLKLIKPNIFISVPRVWEKIYENIERKLSKNGIFSHIVKFIYKNEIIDNLGLSECKLCVTSGAPISNNIINYFNNLGVELHNIYGMTESTGPITLSFKDQFKIRSVGKVLSSTKIKTNKDGEILVKGPSIFKGYHNDDISTKKAFSNGWFKTGDFGYIDPDNFLFVNGRKKDIIITKGGENITPNYIENIILENLPIIDYAVLIGNNKKFLSTLLVLKTKKETSTNIHQCIKKIDNDIHNLFDATKSEKLKSYINNKINIINSKVRDNAHKIQKWIIVPENFMVGEEITHSLKIKRNFISNKYKNLIDEMYN